MKPEETQDKTNWDIGVDERRRSFTTHRRLLRLVFALISWVGCSQEAVKLFQALDAGASTHTLAYQFTPPRCTR